MDPNLISLIGAVVAEFNLRPGATVALHISGYVSGDAMELLGDARARELEKFRARQCAKLCESWTPVMFSGCRVYVIDAPQRLAAIPLHLCHSSIIAIVPVPKSSSSLSEKRFS